MGLEVISIAETLSRGTLVVELKVFGVLTQGMSKIRHVLKWQKGFRLWLLLHATGV